MAVNTKTASRRDLHFDSLAEALADAEQLAAGPHETTGNWSLAQILEHLAKSIAANIDGVKAKPPLPFRVLGPVLKPFLKKQILHKAMTPGFKLPARLKPEFGPADAPALEDALQMYREQIARTDNITTIPDHPFFGQMTAEEILLLHRNHAALHLSFVRSTK